MTNQETLARQWAEKFMDDLMEEATADESVAAAEYILGHTVPRSMTYPLVPATPEPEPGEEEVRMVIIAKAARVIADHNADGVCNEPECIAGDLARAGLLALNRPEPDC